MSYDKSKQEDLWAWTPKTLAQNEAERLRFELQDLLQRGSR